MRVAVFPSDNGGCGWYRLRFAAEQLTKEGHDVDIDPPLGYYHDPNRAEPSRLYLDADVAVVQRVVSDTAVGFIRTLKDHGHRVIVDVDDDLDALHDGHPYRAEVDGSRPDRHGDNLHAACEMADLVTCTTAPLAERYAPHGRYRILPNLVPEKYLRIRANRPLTLGPPPRPLVGWTGRPVSHIADCSVMGGRVGPVVAEAGALFGAWGESAGVTFAQADVPPSAQQRMGYQPLRGGYPEMVAKLTVGVVPLLDSAFNRAKSWLKGIEYAALGVPFVASPRPEYRKLAAMGAGLLADTPAEWAEKVAELLASGRLRAELGESGRAAASALTYEAHSGRWWDAWASTMTHANGVGGMLMDGGEAVPSPPLVEA